jgi:hypothetical protein
MIKEANVADEQEVHLTYQDFGYSVVCGENVSPDERWGVLRAVQQSTVGTEWHCTTCSSERHLCVVVLHCVTFVCQMC